MDNPPAFPVDGRTNPGEPGQENWCGMTLRDWFAGQALISMGTWLPMGVEGEDCGPLNGDYAMRRRSRWAYRHADYMLAERSKP